MTFLLKDETILTIPLELVKLALPNVEKEEIGSHVISYCNPMLTIRMMSIVHGPPYHKNWLQHKISCLIGPLYLSM